MNGYGVHGATRGCIKYKHPFLAFAWSQQESSDEQPVSGDGNGESSEEEDSKGRRVTHGNRAHVGWGHRGKG